ncbi:MAG: glycosyltransferase family 2 protein [Acidimicrobiia bacterium]|nr:glycosyltransferase family 2 protein [Acidimicrobiia bacterium]
MEADQLPSESAPDLVDTDLSGTSAPEREAHPAVVAVVVVEGEAPHLEACLRGLNETEYPGLIVLVMAQTGEDLRPRVAAVAPTAFVRVVAAGGFAAGANEAIETVQGAPFLLFLRPDVVCEPESIRLLVEEAYRSNAAVVGPKIVDVEHPDRLREVGWSIDRFGVPHSEIERDELDQEQHDAVRDVFFVGDACMLVRADLFAALEGFDPACDPGAHDLDLCWRARLAGARVLVAPDARVGRHDSEPPSTGVTRLSHRHRLRSLLTNTSTTRLAWITPVAVLMHSLEAFVFLLRRQRIRASILMGGWAWNLRHIGELRVARKRAQSARVVPEREIHALQYLGSARVANYVANSIHAEDRVRSLSERSRTFAGSARGQFRSLRGLTLLALLLIVVFGSREILFGRLAMVGQFMPWPGVADLVRGFTSHWRYADLGSAAAAPPMFALAGILRTVLLGADGLGQSLLVVAAIPAGILGTRLVAQRILRPGWPDIVAAAAYAVVPLPRTAIETGRLGPLVMYATAPYIFLGVAQVSGLVSSRWPRRRISVLTGLLVALTSVFWPPAVALPVLVALSVAIAAPLTGDDRRRVTAALRGGASTLGIALALLLPWPLSFLAGGDRAGALGIVYDPARSLGPLVRFVTGTGGGGIGGWGLLVGGIVVVLLASGERARWCLRLWALALLSWVLALLPTWLGTASPALEGVLVPAGLALALIVAIGAATFSEELRRSALGWRHVAVVGVAGLIAIAGLGFVGDAVSGRWDQPGSDWNETLSWMQSQRDLGGFRVLWVGSPEVVPGSIHRSGPDAYAITVDGPATLLDAMSPPGGDGTAAARDAVAALRSVETHRLGRLIQPMGVRYVVVVHRPGPGPGTRADPELQRGLDQQLDLRELDGSPGASVYENVEWSAARAAAAGRQRVSDPWPGSGARGDRSVRVWSQQYDDGWEARSGSRTLTHRRVDGWANGFVPVGTDPVHVRDTNQWFRWVALGLEVLIVGWCARQVLRRGRRGRRERREARAAESGTVSS